MIDFIPPYSKYICESNLVNHAEFELRKAGMYDSGPDENELDSKYNRMVADAVMTLVKTFAEQGHSGFSAGMVISIFNKVATFQPLSPITDDPEEWSDVAEECDGTPLWQNKRSPVHFSKDGGKTWYNVDDKAAHVVAEAFSYNVNEEIDSQDEEWVNWFNRRDASTEYWALFGDKYYEQLFLPIEDPSELDRAYTIERLRTAKSESHPLAVAALNYFYNYRKKQISGQNPNDSPQLVKKRMSKMFGIKENMLVPMFEHEYGDAKRQRWFTMKDAQYRYFKNIADGNTGNPVSEYAQRILVSIVQNNMRCSENQYNYLKRMELGKNTPRNYPHTN